MPEGLVGHHFGSTLFRLESLDDSAIEQLIQRGLEAEKAEADADAVQHLVARAEGDGRQSLTSLEVAVALARGEEMTADAGFRPSLRPLSCP